MSVGKFRKNLLYSNEFRFLFLLFALFGGVANAQVDKVFNTPYPARYQAVNDFIRAGESPEADMKRLEILKAETRRRGGPKDMRNIERAELIVKEMWRLDTATFMTRAADLLKRAERAKDYAVIGYVYQTLGDEYYTTASYVKAFEYYLRAYEYYHNRRSSSFPDMAETQMNLAAGYFRFGDYSSALRYSKEIVDHFDPERVWLTILLHDLVGSSYLSLGMPDSAIRYFHRILTYAPMYHSDHGRVVWEGVANGKIGVAFFQKRQYEEAIPFLQKGVKLCRQSGEASNTADFSICLYKIFQAKHNEEQMARYFEIARDAVFHANKLERFIDYYELMSLIKRRDGRASEALIYLDSLTSFRDSLARIINVNKKYVAELDVAREHRLASEKAAAEERNRLVIARNGFITIAVLLMLLTLFLYNRSLLKQKLHQQELMAEKRLSEAELLAATAQLEAIKRNLSEKNELLAQIERDVTAVQDTGLIEKLQQSTILTDEQWEDFRRLFEKAHPGFLQRLKDKFPELSPSETRFLVLARLDYSNKDMAATLGVSAQAIRTTWYRIRKKLGLAEEGTVDELLERI